MDARAKEFFSRSRGARYGLAIAAVFAASSSSAAPAPSSWSLSADVWAAPRQAETILAMAPVASAVRALLANPQGQLMLTHPNSEEGSLWGSELRDWLVSLGIAPQRVRLQPAASATNQLNLSVTLAPAVRSAP